VLDPRALTRFPRFFVSNVPSNDAVPAAGNSVTFKDLALSDAVLAALNDVGYEQPSPIQAATIPHMLAGTDVVGQAQTGTGKTAAFALPLLSKIDLSLRDPQALVLVPTRELAIQVAEAFQRYATHLPGFHVLPIYGGQSYTPQLHSLRRGVHVVIGTPGRIMDHLKRGTLKLDTLRYLVLDEADEMLRMGFIDDVEWILEQAPAARQVALFSATMPTEIRRIAQNHLRKPVEVTIRSKTTTAASIRQRYWMVSGVHKLDALTRILEAEPFEGMLVFTRTKQATTELAERLEARGFAVEALNGDIPQQLRERTVARLKAGQIDIVVATDVAARGLDVERVTHVVNFDVPYDPESYVHRIGRTGRAGRAGEAILFIAPRERNMLRVIERATRQPITQMQLPSVEDVNEQRVNRFNQRITATLEAGSSQVFREVIERYEQAHNVPAIEIAAALASIVQGKTPFLLETEPRARRSEGERVEHPRAPKAETPARAPHVEREARPESERPREARPPRREERAQAHEPRTEMREDVRRKPAARDDDLQLQTYRVEVGSVHGVKPANIVGAIANEAGLDGKFIGRLVICEDHSFVDLPGDMPKEIFRSLQKVRVAGQQLQISLALKTQAERLRRERDDTRGPKSRPAARRPESARASTKPRRPKLAGRSERR
jgi:ATP-dependent RNA helicase DeaD